MVRSALLAPRRADRSVVRCPGDHSRRVLVLERQRVGHRGHLAGIPPEDLHAFAELPGRVPCPEGAVSGRVGGAGPAGLLGDRRGVEPPLASPDAIHRVGWLSRLSGQICPPTRGTLGRQNRHARTLRSPIRAVSTARI